MKIATIGTQCIGKSTYIKDFVSKWPMYKTPEKSYRDYIKEKNLAINEQGTEESQQAILDALLDQSMTFSKHDNVIFDRCPLDNLAYTSWLYLRGLVSESFLDKSRNIVKESLKMYDLLFFFPITKTSPVEIVEDGVRSTNLEYRTEIDNIFKAFYQHHLSGRGAVFPKEDCPAIIEIFGTPEQRIGLTAMYLTELGTPYGEEQSLISDLASFSTEDIAHLSSARGR